jgi:hypothetical protein
MDKDTINRTIAEVCGWKEIPWEELTNPREAREKKLFCIDSPTSRCGWMPDFLNDLNTCAEMVRGLSIHQQDQFSFELWSIIRRDRKASETEVGSVDFLAVNATASQRAEAFLRTLNLWTPTGEENE